MNRKLIAIYSLILGFGITGLWVVIIRSGSIQEGKTEMIFHLFSEFLMAVLCILSGFKILMDHKSATDVNLIAHGMVVYSVLNAAGYYSEKGESAMVIMFILLLIISVTIILAHILPYWNINKLFKTNANKK
ncbi:MAG TPA: hypothetical protein VMV47_06345 [Bacteroidales bacterium]|nr:hypothetical protein [Bacteroidales bacterium]